MRPAFLLFTSLLSCSITYAQIVTDDMGDEFKEMSKFGSRATGFEGFQTYHSTNVEGSQFFSAGWSTGTVTTLSNEHFGKNYFFLYDKVRQELFMKFKDSPVVLLADKKMIAAFTLNTDRTHNFVAAGQYDPSNKGNFFEVLVESDSGYSLFKSIKSKFVKADERDMEKQKLGDIYDSFVDEITYYIIKDGEVKAFALRKNSILKSLPSMRDKVSAYFSQHEDHPLDETFLIGLTEHLNG
jgi:hypothetical protein